MLEKLTKKNRARETHVQQQEQLQRTPREKELEDALLEEQERRQRAEQVAAALQASSRSSSTHPKSVLLCAYYMYV